MKDSYKAKVIYFKKLKQFDGDPRVGFVDELSQAFPYPEYNSREEILENFDKDYQEQAEIWDVLITVETV
jgi:hypothetical protein